MHCKQPPARGSVKGCARAGTSPLCARVPAGPELESGTLGLGLRGSSGFVGPREVNVVAGQRGGPRVVRESQVEEEELHFWHDLAKAHQHHLPQATQQPHMSEELQTEQQQEVRGQERGRHKDAEFRQRAAQEKTTTGTWATCGCSLGPISNRVLLRSTQSSPHAAAGRGCGAPLPCNSAEQRTNCSPRLSGRVPRGNHFSFTLEPGGLVPASICTTAYKAGFSLALRGLSRRMRPVAAVCRGLARCSGQATVGANLYLTPRGLAGSGQARGRPLRVRVPAGRQQVVARVQPPGPSGQARPPALVQRCARNADAAWRGAATGDGASTLRGTEQQ